MNLALFILHGGSARAAFFGPPSAAGSIDPMETKGG